MKRLPHCNTWLSRPVWGVLTAAIVLCWAAGADSPVDFTRGPLEVTEDGRHLQHADGTPFFYLGDTAWQLFHDPDREEAETYLRDRSAKGYTVIQAVALAEYGGLTRPNPEGELPLVDNDPAQPNEAYFEHIDFIVDLAEELGMFTGMLPTWGDKWNQRWGEGPEIFTPENARAYGEFLGERYKDKPIIWILGGDRIPEEDIHFDIIRAKAEGIRSVVGDEHLMTFHPMGGRSSSEFFHEDEWLDFNMFQSGHSQFNTPNYEQVLADRELVPVKPVLDGEPCYEDHPVNWNPSEGWFDSFDVRQAAYWAVLSGAAGHTYGDHNIWQMWHPDRPPISSARTPWREALHHEGSGQMTHMRDLMEEMGWQELEPDLDLVRRAPAEEPAAQPRKTHLAYTRDAGGNARFYVDGEPIADSSVPGGLEPWDREFRLALANELTGDRPWLGTYRHVALYNRALEPGEIEAHHDGGAPEHLDGLQARYAFDEGEGGVVHDVSGAEPALDLHISNTDSVAWTENGLEIHDSVLVATDGSAERLTQAIQNSEAFTLEAWITPHEEVQTGPARIVSLSTDITTRNFTLGQLEDAYEMRFRTTETTPNGEPPLRTPGGEAAGRFVAASRSDDGDRAIIYTPQGGILEVDMEALQDGVTAEWFCPRTAERTEASAGEPGQFSTPSEEDWVLVLQ